MISRKRKSVAQVIAEPVAAPRSMLDLYKSTQPVNQLEALLDKERDYKRREDKLRRLLGTAIKDQEYELASKLQRDIQIIRFQMLQQKPAIQDLRDRAVLAGKLRNEIEEGTYKQRIQMIKDNFMQVQELLNKVAPPRNEYMDSSYTA